MKPIRKFFCIASLMAILVASPVQAFTGKAKRQAPSSPPSSYQGQWYTTPDGCSYSRAKAPGYATMWVLILNPHHIGQPAAKAHCATLLAPRG